MTSMPHSVDTPKTRNGLRRTLYRTIQFGRQTGIALTSVVHVGEQQTMLTSNRGAGVEQVLTTSRTPSRCNLCGSSSSPQYIHYCPRLYGR